MVALLTMLNYDKTDTMDVSKNKKAYKGMLRAVFLINFYQWSHIWRRGFVVGQRLTVPRGKFIVVIKSLTLKAAQVRLEY